VLTGGASTTYGADAVSGVVNFITRKDFAGAEFNVSNSITEEGDGHQFRADLVVGANFDDGRGNATFSVGYQEVDPIYQGARPISFDTIETFGGTALGSGTSVPSRFSVPGLGTRQVDPTTGNLVPTFQTFNFNPFNVFQVPFERYNMFGSANYEITDGLEVYTRGIFSKNTVTTIIAPSGAFGIAVQIPVSNPFLPAGVRNTFCAANDTNLTVAGNQTLTPAQCAAAAAATSPADPNYREFTTSLFRRSVEAGPRTSEYATTFFDYQLGLRGDVSDTVGWDVFGSYGESENLETIGGYFLNSRVRQSLLTTRDASGAVVCQNTANGCVPANFFGAQGSLSPDAVDFLTEESQVKVRTTLAQVRATLSGDVGVTSPFAEDPIAFAVGGEYRKYGATQKSDLLARGGDLGGAGGADPDIDGGFEVREALAELIVPLASGRPFMENVQLEAGIRYSDYKIDAAGSPGFNTTTYKVGGNWEFGSGVKLRGNYARAVRAPNIAELFTPVTTGLTNLGDDPCASVDGNGGAVPGRGAITGTLREVCLAQGAPAATIGFIEQPISGQANQTSGGNLAVEPEKSNSYTVGLVLQPDFVPGLTVSVDYFNIKVTGAITNPTPGDAITACFGNPTGANYSPPAGAAQSAACTGIGRDPLTGGLNGDPNTTRGLPLFLSNAGKLETDGIDLVVNYNRDIGFARLSLGFTGTYTFNNKFNAFVANPDSVNRECINYVSANCGSLQPELQFSQRTTLALGDSFDISLLWRYLSSFEQEPLDVIASGPFFNGTIPATVPGIGGRTENFGDIPATSYFDLSTRFTINDNVSFTFLVENLLDKNPPITGNNAGSTAFNSGNTFPSTYDALGRTYTLSARLKF
jgi:outer membrane receptor protein involved in Fe transport